MAELNDGNISEEQGNMDATSGASGGKIGKSGKAIDAKLSPVALKKGTPTERIIKKIMLATGSPDNEVTSTLAAMSAEDLLLTTKDYRKALDIISGLTSSEINETLKKWNVGNSGVVDVVNRHDLPQVVDLEGDLKLRMHLVRYVESRAHEPIFLPFGEIGQLSEANTHKINTYLSMIAMRRKEMPDVDYESVLLMNATEREDDQVVRERAAQLKKWTASAVERYMLNFVITPLLRDALVQRAGVRKLTGVPVMETAVKYSKWKEKAQQNILRTPLINQITSFVNSNNWLDSFNGLKDSLLSGFDQSSFIGLPLLINTIEGGDIDPSVDLSNLEGSYDKIADTSHTGYGLSTSKSETSAAARRKTVRDMLEEEQKFVKATTPLYQIDRSAILTSIDGGPLWVHDKFSANVDFDVTKEDVAWLILQLARLKNIPITDTASLEFMSRYPQWAGLMMTASEEPTPSTEFKAFVDRLMEMEYIRMATKLPSVDQSLTALFDEPNRADLQGGFASSLYFVALTHKVANTVLTDLLMVIKSSIEYANDDFWAELNSILELGEAGLYPSLQGFKYVRTYNVKNPMIALQERNVMTHYYFMEKDLKITHPVTDHLTSFLRNAKSLGEMHTSMVSVRPFVTTDPGYFDETQLILAEEFVPLGQVKLEAMMLDTIDMRHPLHAYKESLTPRKGNRRTSHKNYVIVGQANTMIVSTYNVAKSDYLPFETEYLDSDDFDLSEVFASVPKFGRLLVLKPTNAFHIASGESFNYNPEVIELLPRSADDLSKMLKKWEFNMFPDIQDPNE